ncbi:4'-phosphopantetheinyl transferase [Streptomyces sp. QL37]|uniref:4'-phosphopantetheinyl transferase family protein n=1 Tax=Streptomyces sp. QL37 TaxID=2093747 RepID=UPI000CF2489F|nr:4'-phosphopantetheinyl transferase superfamily protein [Streptomyces sp. QL37]PPQ57499.1 4'-phosphopantetheinyl transferase [Streptomyces sp. QL37]
MIDELLPACVAAAHTFGDVADADLLPEELRHMAGAVERRRRSFRTGRHCARQALASLGRTARHPLLPGPHGEPLWPRGVVGSITHCEGYRAAAVAEDRDLASLGIDAEPHAALPAGVLRKVMSPHEGGRLARLFGLHPEVHWDRLLFSAKEAVYKTWFPLTGTGLGLQDIEVTIAPGLRGSAVGARGATGSGAGAGTGAFHAHVPRSRIGAGRLSVLRGHWLVRDGLLVTAAIRTREEQTVESW